MNKVVFGNSYLLLFILTTFMFEGCLVYVYQKKKGCLV